MAKDIRYKLGDKVRVEIENTREEVGTIAQVPTKREPDYIGGPTDFYYVVDFPTGKRKVAQGDIMELVQAAGAGK